MAAKRKINPALLKPLKPSANLAAVVGSASLPRSQAIKKT
jgi:chromatin remodeling complex protein RSC6